MSIFFKASRRSLATNLTATAFALVSTVAAASMCSIQCTTAAAGAKQAMIASIPGTVSAGCAWATASGGFAAYNSCYTQITNDINNSANETATKVYNSCMASCVEPVNK